MRVKRYRAKSMAEAMALVRADLGPDAVILHSSTTKGKLAGILGTATLEVMAATDTDLHDFPRQTPAAASAIQEMQHEMAAMKSIITEVANSRQVEYPGISGNLDGHYQKLLGLGITTNLAQQITRSVADELSHSALQDRDVVRQYLWWQMRHRIPSCAPFQPKPGRQLIVFLIGPTGVGKTTTIAKLAANFSYSQRIRVLMITTDTFRVAAIPQMLALGEYLRLPVQVAHNPHQLANLIEKNRNFYDLILIDTPGRSQRNAPQVAELSDYLAAVDDKAVYLSVSAGSKFEDLLNTVEVFGGIQVDGLVLTKLDETLSLGAAYSLVCETGIPVSYLTTGQQIPEDIQAASADRLVDLMIGSASC